MYVMRKHSTRKKSKIVGRVEYMDGDTKVIVYEYDNGAKSHTRIRPKRPFYKHVWFYFLVVALVVALFFLMLLTEPYWNS